MPQLTGINYVLAEYLGAHPRPIEPTEEVRLDAIFDSLTFLDLFLFLESRLGERVSLDDLVRFTSVADLSDFLDEVCAKGKHDSLNER